MWWMDLEPYPGPPENTITAVFHEAATQWGKSFSEMARTFAAVGNAYHISIEQAAGSLTQTFKVLRETVPKPARHGPRRGPAYDHQGRRRW